MDFLRGLSCLYRVLFLAIPAQPIALFLKVDIGHPFSRPLIVGHAGTAAGIGASQLLVPL